LPDSTTLEALVAAALAADGPAVGYGGRAGRLRDIDLGGAVFVLDRPLRIAHAQLVGLCNGALLAGPGFPAGQALVVLRHVTGLRLRQLRLDCAGRADGIVLRDFFRVRIERCHIRHPRHCGILSARQGNNHELEVLSCVLTGAPPARPARGTGILLGQADNVVSDCTLEGFRLGIRCGMRANRITGNHIRAAGRSGAAMAIAGENRHKASAMIHHNLFEDCAIQISCDDHDRLNRRNYFHITDNAFTGVPAAGAHVVLRALRPGSRLGNLHLCDNRLAGPCPGLAVAAGAGADCGFDPAGGPALRMGANASDPDAPVQGSTVTRTVAVRADQRHYVVCFRDAVPFGALVHAVAEWGVLAQGTPRPPVLRRLEGAQVHLELPDPQDGTIRVTATTRGPACGRFRHVAA
jgi:hypothetical protein